jgi:hypothetical protein
MAKEEEQQPPQFYRHGDLLIRRIEFLPQGLTKLNTNILAEGEATGHQHRLTSKTAQVFGDGAKQQKYLSLEEPTQLVHEEHKPITIDEGTYLVIQEREFDPFGDYIRRVAD